jgi:hypothetical protein
MKDCPNCKLLNPESAERCDCGYDFLSGSMQRSFLTDKDRWMRKGGTVGALMVVIFIERLLIVKKAVDSRLTLAVALFVGVIGLVAWEIFSRSKYFPGKRK